MNGVDHLFLVLHGNGLFLGFTFGEHPLGEDVIFVHVPLPLYPHSLLVLDVLVQFTNDDGRH